ncbi:UPF0182 family protein [Phosphitispora fastidiosa]|uniref:UPF0182 family protein n=1 Tax=Phosphitispora fastidiosa TaxID=2837202 RepID=UPI002F40A69C
MIFAALLIRVLSGFYVKLAWFRDLGYSQLFMTPLLAKLQIGAASFIIYFLIIFIMGIIAFRALLLSGYLLAPSVRKLSQRTGCIFMSLANEIDASGYARLIEKISPPVPKLKELK